MVCSWLISEDDEAVFGEVSVSAIHPALIFAICSQISSHYQMCDWPKSVIILFINFCC